MSIAHIDSLASQTFFQRSQTSIVPAQSRFSLTATVASWSPARRSRVRGNGGGRSSTEATHAECRHSVMAFCFLRCARPVTGFRTWRPPFVRATMQGVCGPCLPFPAGQTREIKLVLWSSRDKLLDTSAWDDVTKLRDGESKGWGEREPRRTGNAI